MGQILNLRHDTFKFGISSTYSLFSDLRFLNESSEMESKEHPERFLKEEATALSRKWEYIERMRGKRVNPPYMPHGNPSQVIFESNALAH